MAVGAPVLAEHQHSSSGLRVHPCAARVIPVVNPLVTRH